MNHEPNEKTKASLIVFYGFVAVVVLLFFVSCARPSGSGLPSAAAPEKSVDPYAHLDADERIAMSDVITDDGEENFQFATANEAWGKFNEALQVNPANQRAMFMRELLKPLLELKGIVARLRPLYLKAPNGLERYMVLRRQLSADIKPAFFNFLNDGPEDIDTDEKFLDWMDRAIVSLDTLRTFIGKNKDKAFTIRLSEQLLSIEAVKNHRDGSCTAMTLMTASFAGCPTNGMHTIKLNRGDLEALQYIVSKQMVEFSLLYAYKLSPTKLIEGQRGRQSTKEFLEGLLNGYDGNILARNRIALAKSILPDWIAAERFVIENQDELCGRQNRDQASAELCVKKGAINHEARNLEVLETLLAGKPVQIDQSLLPAPVKVDVMKILNQPPASISEFFPTEYDGAGDPTKFNETVYASYFVEGDANSLWSSYQREKKEIYAGAVAYRQQIHRSSMGIREKGVLASGEIIGFEYSSCDRNVCFMIKAPRATLSATDVVVAFGADDRAVNVTVTISEINKPMASKTFSGREAIVNPESKTISVDSSAAVVVIDLLTGTDKTTVKPESR